MALPQRMSKLLIPPLLADRPKQDRDKELVERLLCGPEVERVEDRPHTTVLPEHVWNEIQVGLDHTLSVQIP